jgi:hypothetical protein
VGVKVGFADLLADSKLYFIAKTKTYYLFSCITSLVLRRISLLNETMVEDPSRIITEGLNLTVDRGQQ